MIIENNNIMAFIKYCLFVGIVFLSVTSSAQEIKWLSWEEAAAANEKMPKKFLVDIYTNWCGWCKKMDATTFKDPALVKYVNTYFYPVKLNAEQRESITWQGQEFVWKAGGRDGYHQLAYDLVNGRLSYPTFVLLDDHFTRILISPGYKTADVMMKELEYAGGNHYKTVTWEDFKNRS